MNRYIWINLLTMMLTNLSGAVTIKISGTYGVGNFAVTHESQTKSEGPSSFGMGLDVDLNSRFSLGAEHLRSLSISPLGTSVGFTGLTTRWYPFGPVPNSLDFSAPYPRARVLQRGFFPYLGWGVGFTQASIPGNNEEPNLVALNLSLVNKFGFDYPILGLWGWRTEITFGIPFWGSGKAQFTTLNTGLYFFW
jgi:hypothetical protein